MTIYLLIILVQNVCISSQFSTFGLALVYLFIYLFYWKTREEY